MHAKAPPRVAAAAPDGLYPAGPKWDRKLDVTPVVIDEHTSGIELTLEEVLAWDPVVLHAKEGVT